MEKQVRTTADLPEKETQLWDNTRGGSTGSMLGQGRGKDQCNDPRNQTEEKYHINPITHKGDTRDEEDVGKTYHWENIET
jgi:hypothetical protein